MCFSHLVHIFHFLQTGMVFKIVITFREYLMQSRALSTVTGMRFESRNRAQV